MVTKTAAYIFGVFFLLIGILGYVPAFTPNAQLLGIFDVSPLHNAIHVLSGIAALVGAMAYGSMGAKWYFRIFGIVYGLVTIVGFVQGSTVLGLFGVNVADNLLHLTITAIALYLGFGMKESSSGTMNA